ncbi:flagellar biosynthetic protein FliO [Christensenellaceae bacterium OttesenSCG-928-K19]|nr:flagellar biosynthetic protein FliO [Christensenellaceae bacterium OttesenSCG-928-K19]
MWKEQSNIVVDDVQLASEINVGSIILVIVFLIAMLVGAYYLTKFVNKRALQKGMKQKPAGTGKWRAPGHQPGRLVTVADRIAVDRDKTVMVVEFRGKYYLLSTTQQDIRLIDSVEISPEDIVREEADAEFTENADVIITNDSFGAFMKDVGSGIKNRFYAFFHKGKLPPQKESFEAQLKKKLEDEEK